MNYRHFTNVPNQEFRDTWVEEQIDFVRAKAHLKPLDLLDVGAGLSPYKGMILSKNINYFSQDFSAYQPNINLKGFQENSWDYPKHDYICDILEISTEKKYDILLCTEVLEHLPDPRRSFEVLVSLLNPGGTRV